MGRPIGIDLFSGAGGMSLGFEKAGFDIAASVEIDPIHCAAHKFNFPLCTTICASVENLSGDDIRKLAGLENKDIDVVFGGAPCQGFSLIGKRALDDPRNQLVSHFVRLVSELSPKFCVFENVKGLTIGKHAKFLGEIIESLNDAGYSVLTPYQVLNASKFGVPQSRERLFLIAAKKGQNMPSYPKPLEYSVTVGDAISDLPDADTFSELKKLDSVQTSWTTISNYARILRGLDEDKKDYGYEREFNRNLLSSSLRTEHSKLSQERFIATPNGETEPVSRFRKLDLNGLCNTLRAGTDSARGAFTSPRPIHPTLPRVITVREAARLHSYPDWFRFHSTKWHGFRQLGNSVPPFLARAVASVIIETLNISPSKPKRVLKLGDEWLLTLDMKSAAKFFEVPVDTIAQRTRKEKKEAVNE